MRLDRLTPEDVISIHDQLGREIAREEAEQLALSGAFSLSDETGVFAIGGIHEVRPGVGQAWTLLDRRWRKYARDITRLCEYALNNSDLKRIEAGTIAGWSAGMRWLERMGFVLETREAKLWDGEHDYSLFVRLKNGDIANSGRGRGDNGVHDHFGILGSGNGCERGAVDHSANPAGKERSGGGGSECRLEGSGIA